ncbi:ABC transporter substrate-binding protein [Streptacidiphilus carbonis]|uniref:ABC transporter substrate-binding protein n=1 Tax=Streptacidiphilus carbonis TaxID=105422 RepID=UPI0005AA8E31|nr:ABC transporter substrate-binding protein [Streptacidiphilus carbonis]
MSAAKRLAALGCIGLLTATAACGSTSSGSKGGAGSTITLGTVSSYTSLDPAGAYDAGSWTVFYNVYQGLMTYLPGANTPSPDAAKSCKFTDGSYLTYVCTLLPDLKFSNGDPLDAAAVKYSFDRVLKVAANKADNGSGVSVLLDTLQSVETSGSTQITFHLKTADATFPDRIASGVGEIVDPKVYPTTKLLDGTGVVGSGIYKIDSVQTTTDAKGAVTPVSVKLVLNPDYKGAYSSTKPMNAGATLKFYDSPAKVKSALQSGDIDLNAGSDLAPADIVALQGAQQLGKGIQVVQGTGSSTRMMVLNVGVAPFTNPAVRQAIGKLIDRQAIADKVYQSTVTPLYSVIPQGIGDQTRPFEQTPYAINPIAAGQVKNSLSGVKLPIDFTLTYAANSAAGPAEAAQIKSQLEASGIFKVTLKSVPNLGALIPLWSSGKLGASLTGWQADYPDADDFVSPFIGKDNTFGNNYAPSKIINDLHPLSLKEADRADQTTTDTFTQIQKQIAEDAAYIPLWQDNQYIATQANITGVPLTLDIASIMRFWMIGKN